VNADVIAGLPGLETPLSQSVDILSQQRRFRRPLSCKPFSHFDFPWEIILETVFTPWRPTNLGGSVLPTGSAACPDFQSEQLRRAAHSTISGVVIANFRGLLESVGVEKALSAYRPMGVYSGTAMAHNFIGRLDLRGDGLEVIGVPQQTLMGNMYGGSSEPVEIREHGATVKHTSCPFFEAGAPPPQACEEDHDDLGIGHTIALGGWDHRARTSCYHGGVERTRRE
jgi:hypothetical protein